MNSTSFGKEYAIVTTQIHYSFWCKKNLAECIVLARPSKACIHLLHSDGKESFRSNEIFTLSMKSDLKGACRSVPQWFFGLNLESRLETSLQFSFH